uniref:PHD-type domain-containing protein n=1 Tax=Cyprinus carpio carpio TaxID=630221 RepID=A0A9J7YVT9_CYPCA
MAGIAESCTHVGALLFKIEAAVRIRGTKTVTDVPAYWMMPANVDKVQAEVGHKIDFTTGAAKRVALYKCISGERGMSGIRTHLGSTSHCAHEPTLSDLSPLLQILHTHSKAVCLSGMEEYYHHYIDPVKPHVLPKSLQHLRDPGKDGCDLPVLFQHCNTLTHLVAVTETQAAAIEAQTRLQHRSSVWYTSRAGRITASNMHAVMSTSVEKPATSTVSIDPLFPEVGASPDGLIHCTCCGKGCLEIKCTFKHRNNSILQACADDSTFCLQVTDGKLHLKQTHMYYSQVQTQIFVTGSQFCDFVVWTEKDCVVVRVLPDADYWTTLLKRAQEFFHKVSLPELVSCYYTQQASTKTPVSTELQPSRTKRTRTHTCENVQRLWCICKGPEDLDDMVACDNENCVVQWFHLSCVGLSQAPSETESWLCTSCTH